MKHLTQFEYLQYCNIASIKSHDTMRYIEMIFIFVLGTDYQEAAMQHYLEQLKAYSIQMQLRKNENINAT